MTLLARVWNREATRLIVGLEMGPKKLKMVKEGRGQRSLYGVHSFWNKRLFLKMLKISRDDLQLYLSKDKAVEIISNNVISKLVKRYALRNINLGLKFFILDTLYQSGGKDLAFETLQKEINNRSMETKLIVDGVFGKKTVKALKRCWKQDDILVSVYDDIFGSPRKYKKFLHRYKWRIHTAKLLSVSNHFYSKVRDVKKHFHEIDSYN